MSYEVKLALGISAVIIAVIAFGIYIGMQIWVKKYRAKILKKTQEEAMIQINSMRNDIGELPFPVKDYLKSKANDIDVEGIINTVYINNYKNVLVINNNDLFPVVAIASKVKANTYVYYNETNYDQLQDIQNRFPEHVPNLIKTYDDSVDLDCLVIMHSQEDINDIFDRFNKLMDKGMILVAFSNPRSEIKRLLSYLKMTDIRYEVSFLSSKYLFVVKK
ncbi:BC85_0335 family putative methyltransferase [Mycoplasmopsis verecunda]|uniref:Uncharacterized protein n=1 Tax=Mycoplasmopsis verecunda TaxID=171291 RepID=A0A1T4LA45_9BACT|nr:hypothetical protein [Mycoplasmopsis verecunda]WPB54477.1 hypothetical protein SAM46_03260 [Mycoplasmopsis verecunda]SJZ51377.1 hypothetical protein SAMN02745154_00382 [Mycoplasmopsis verecunda]